MRIHFLEITWCYHNGKRKIYQYTETYRAVNEMFGIYLKTCYMFHDKNRVDSNKIWFISIRYAQNFSHRSNHMNNAICLKKKNMAYCAMFDDELKHWIQTNQQVLLLHVKVLYGSMALLGILSFVSALLSLSPNIVLSSCCLSLETPILS